MGYEVYFILIANTLNAHCQTSLVRTYSVRTDQSSIWGILANSSEDDKMVLTVSRVNIIYFQYVNKDLEMESDQVEVYGDKDNLHQIVDHKTVFWKDHYYTTFSSAEEETLYLVKPNQEG